MVDQALPRTGWKGRIAALKHIPTVLKIVWQASPLLSILGLVFRGLVALIPISMLWISKLIIDRVVHAISQRGTGFAEIGWLLVSVWLVLGTCSRESLIIVTVFLQTSLPS
jgi:ATP-binding cassette, subfamily B, bacterial